MRITLRLILSLGIAASTVVFASTSYQARQEERRLLEELDQRTALLAESLRELAEPLLGTEQQGELQGLLERFGNRERLAGVALYEPDGHPLAVTPGFPEQFRTMPSLAEQAVQLDASQ